MIAGSLAETGKVGGSVSPERAKELATVCALNALAAVKTVIGDLDKIKRIVKVVGFVSSVPEFSGQPAVVNGASEFLSEVFGEKGIHARSAVGVAVLPMDAPVEIELIVEV
jgi:enamine deaminase RidA (YjgF/YER057c/UK114 family)